MKAVGSLHASAWSLLLALIAFTGMASAAPTPALVPPPGTWQLEIEFHGDPQRIEVLLPGDTQPRTYWYLLYTIINNTGRDQDFYPEFYLYTDTFKLYNADIEPRKEVFEVIRKRYETTIPLLEHPSKITGKILQGKDNARDSVAVFGEFDPQAKKASIFIAGLSNETVAVKYPAATDPEGKNIKEILLRKTLMLEYQIPGDSITPENRVMLYRNRQWIMR